MPTTEIDQIAEKEILIDEAIAHLRHFCKLYGIPSLFVVGGFCRALYFNKRWEVNDIDVASAFHDQAVQLGGLFASEVLNTIPKFSRRHGTASVEYRGDTGAIKIEFQGKSTNSYMFNEEVKNWMHEHQIEDVPMMNNIYGRDFTMNSLIMSLSDGKVHDLTGRATKDLERKLIVPLLPAEMLVKYSPVSILRAIRFAIRYDFYIDSDLRKAMKNNLQSLVDTISQERIVKEIVRILKLDSAKGLEMLKRFGLDQILMDSELREYVYLEGKVDE